MSDTFWLAFFGLLTLIVKDWLDQRRQAKLAQKTREIANELHINTRETIMGREAVTEKIDSATKNVNDNVAASAVEIKQDALKTAAAGVVVAKETARTAKVVSQEAKDATQEAKAASQEILKQLGPIQERLNGGPGGLNELSERVTALEAKTALIVQGQIDLIKSVNHFSEIIERKMC